MIVVSLLLAIVVTLVVWRIKNLGWLYTVGIFIFSAIGSFLLLARILSDA
ncbi:MAG: hypothetical protein ACK59C_01530 [Holosporales bacterium]|jgi:hypothetical protein